MSPQPLFSMPLLRSLETRASLQDPVSHSACSQTSWLRGGRQHDGGDTAPRPFVKSAFHLFPHSASFTCTHSVSLCSLNLDMLTKQTSHGTHSAAPSSAPLRTPSHCVPRPSPLRAPSHPVPHPPPQDLEPKEASSPPVHTEQMAVVSKGEQRGPEWTHQAGGCLTAPTQPASSLSPHYCPPHAPRSLPTPHPHYSPPSGFGLHLPSSSWDLPLQPPAQVSPSAPATVWLLPPLLPALPQAP